jgi:hypothetical protein
MLISTDTGGMSYLRVIPASQIEETTTKENNLEQELAFTLKPQAFADPLTYPAYDPDHPRASSPDDHAGDVGLRRALGFASCPVVIHYAINKPAGAIWWESDLSPILKWL